MLKGPRNLSVPQLTRIGAAQPEGLQLLTASIKALKEKYVEYVVQTHHKLLPVSSSCRASFEERTLALSLSPENLRPPGLGSLSLRCTDDSAVQLPFSEGLIDRVVR